MKIGLDISVLSDSQRTGIGVYTYELIKALLEVNQKDQFILFGLATFQTYDYLRNLDLKNYPNVKMKVYKWPGRLFRRTFLNWQRINYPPIESFIGPVDVFHSFNWFLPPQKSGKTVATVFDLTALAHPEWHQPQTAQLDKLRLERISRKADLVLAISENSKTDLLKFNSDLNVKVIYPGVSEVFKSKTDSKTSLKVLNKYHIKKPFFLSVATLEPRKNLEFLVTNYLKSNLSSQLVLVGGEGWKSQSLKKLALDYPDKIILTGFTRDDELAALYSQTLALIYPSLYEGFGIPVLEAMSIGAPVVTSEVSSLPEVGQRAVLYINPTNGLDLQKVLIKLAKDQKLRQKLSKAGKISSKKFDWQISAQKLIACYQQLILAK